MFYSDDPFMDFKRHDMAMARREAMLPVCEKCMKRIQDEEFYDDGEEILCEKHLKEKYSRSTEDYLRDQE